MKEALKLALEKVADALPAYIGGVAAREYLAVIHKALAQPEQEPVVWDVHTEHCFQDEYQHCCKYGDGDDCTAKPTKEALAQGEQSSSQEPCGGCGGSGWVPRDPDIGTDQECFDCNGSGAQPEQEPWCMKMNGCKTKCEDCPDEAAKPERPWVGLTDEEIESCANWRWMTTCRAIEAKLKAVNGFLK